MYPRVKTIENAPHQDSRSVHCVPRSFAVVECIKVESDLQKLVSTNRGAEKERVKTILKQTYGYDGNCFELKTRSQFAIKS